MRVTFTHDVEHALSTMVDLVNTDPATGGEELLPDVAALEAFVHQHAVSDIGELTQDDLVAVHATRPRLRQVFLAESPRQAASLLNDLLNTHTLTPPPPDHDGYDWHIHYFAPGAAPPTGPSPTAPPPPGANRLHVAAYRERRRAAAS